MLRLLILVSAGNELCTFSRGRVNLELPNPTKVGLLSGESVTHRNETSPQYSERFPSF